MMGRPPHGIGKDALKTVLVSLPIRLISWVDRRAEQLGISRSAVVRTILDEAYENRPKVKLKKSKD